MVFEEKRSPIDDMPKSLRKWITKSFADLVDVASETGKECIEDPNEESVEERVASILYEIESVVNGRPIYRAIEVGNISESLNGLRNGCKRVHGCGQHWSADIEGADISWKLNMHSEGWYIQEEETEKGWKKGPGIIIIEAVVTDPSAIDFDGTIDEQISCEFRWGDTAREENEITIKDDTKLKITRLGAGITVGQARRNLLEEPRK